MAIRPSLPDWMDEAACKGMDVDFFFPGHSYKSKPDVEAPRQFCEGCPVKEECAEYAQQTKTYWGIWGGTTRYDRKQEATRRNQLEESA